MLYLIVQNCLLLCLNGSMAIEVILELKEDMINNLPMSSELELLLSLHDSVIEIVQCIL